MRRSARRRQWRPTARSATTTSSARSQRSVKPWRTRWRVCARSDWRRKPRTRSPPPKPLLLRARRAPGARRHKLAMGNVTLLLEGAEIFNWSGDDLGIRKLELAFGDVAK